MSDFITSFNSTLILSAAPLFPVGVKIKDYSDAKMFGADNQAIHEHRLGVDGKLVAGVVKAEVKMSIELLPTSESRKFFEAIASASKTTGNVYYLTGTLSMPSISAIYTLTRGIIVDYPAVVSASKTLDNLTYNLVWQNVIGASL